MSSQDGPGDKEKRGSQHTKRQTVRENGDGDRERKKW